MIDGDSRINYAEFDRRTDQLAWALRDVGVRQGDRVAGLLVNSAAFLETMFATAKLGAVFVCQWTFVPINFRLAPPEVTFVLADSGADVFVWSDHHSPLARAALAGEGVRVRARMVVGGEPADGEENFDQALASGEPGAIGTVAGSDLRCLYARERLAHFKWADRRAADPAAWCPYVWTPVHRRRGLSERLARACDACDRVVTNAPALLPRRTRSPRHAQQHLPNCCAMSPGVVGFRG